MAVMPPVEVVVTMMMAIRWMVLGMAMRWCWMVLVIGRCTMMTMKPALPVVVGMGGGVATVMMRQRRMVMVMGGHMMMRCGHVVMHRDADVTMRHR